MPGSSVCNEATEGAGDCPDYVMGTLSGRDALLVKGSRVSAGSDEVEAATGRHLYACLQGRLATTTALLLAFWDLLGVRQAQRHGIGS